MRRVRPGDAPPTAANEPRFRAVKVLGQGSFGKAVLVEDKRESGRLCVVKQINMGKLTSREQRKTQQEAALLATLSHPNIVAYIDSYLKAGNRGSFLYIVMEYADGGTLLQLVKERRGNRWPESTVLDMFVQVCLAVKHIHDRKVVHRDIKTENIFCTRAGVLKLGDFGVSKVLEGTRAFALTKIGTPLYMSPEIMADQQYDTKADIWSLGCVLHELASLNFAFRASNMKELILRIQRAAVEPIPPSYSTDLRSLVTELLSKDPSNRPSANSILARPLVRDRIKLFLSEVQYEHEFSHTVIHGVPALSAQNLHGNFVRREVDAPSVPRTPLRPQALGRPAQAPALNLLVPAQPARQRREPRAKVKPPIPLRNPSPVQVAPVVRRGRAPAVRSPAAAAAVVVAENVAAHRPSPDNVISPPPQAASPAVNSPRLANEKPRGVSMSPAQHADKDRVKKMVHQLFTPGKPPSASVGNDDVTPRQRHDVAPRQRAISPPNQPVEEDNGVRSPVRRLLELEAIVDDGSGEEKEDEEGEEGPPLARQQAIDLSADHAWQGVPDTAAVGSAVETDHAKAAVKPAWLTPQQLDADTPAEAEDHAAVRRKGKRGTQPERDVSPQREAGEQEAEAVQQRKRIVSDEYVRNLEEQMKGLQAMVKDQGRRQSGQRGGRGEVVPKPVPTPKKQTPLELRRVDYRKEAGDEGSRDRQGKVKSDEEVEDRGRHEQQEHRGRRKDAGVGAESDDDVEEERQRRDMRAARQREFQAFRREQRRQLPVARDRDNVLVSPEQLELIAPHQRRRLPSRPEVDEEEEVGSVLSHVQTPQSRQRKPSPVVRGSSPSSGRRRGRQVQETPPSSARRRKSKGGSGKNRLALVDDDASCSPQAEDKKLARDKQREEMRAMMAQHRRHKQGSGGWGREDGVEVHIGKLPLVKDQVFPSAPVCGGSEDEASSLSSSYVSLSRRSPVHGRSPKAASTRRSDGLVAAQGGGEQPGVAPAEALAGASPDAEGASLVGSEAHVDDVEDDVEVEMEFEGVSVGSPPISPHHSVGIPRSHQPSGIAQALDETLYLSACSSGAESEEDGQEAAAATHAGTEVAFTSSPPSDEDDGAGGSLQPSPGEAWVKEESQHSLSMKNPGMFEEILGMAEFADAHEDLDDSEEGAAAAAQRDWGRLLRGDDDDEEEEQEEEATNVEVRSLFVDGDTEMTVPAGRPVPATNSDKHFHPDDSAAENIPVMYPIDEPEHERNEADEEVQNANVPAGGTDVVDSERPPELRPLDVEWMSSEYALMLEQMQEVLQMAEVGSSEEDNDGGDEAEAEHSSVEQQAPQPHMKETDVLVVAMDGDGHQDDGQSVPGSLQVDHGSTGLRASVAAFNSAATEGGGRGEPCNMSVANEMEVLKVDLEGRLGLGAFLEAYQECTASINDARGLDVETHRKLLRLVVLEHDFFS